MFLFKQTWDDIYNFNADDLKANTSANMSEKQRRGYHFMIYKWLLIGIPLGFLVSLFATVYIFNHLDPYRISPTMDTIFLGIVGCFMCVLFSYMVIFWGRLRSDFKDNNVLGVSGSANVKKQLLMIDGVTFRTNIAAWFQTDKNYRVYYLPRSKVILSVEELL